MNKMRNWIVGLTWVSLLAVGVVAVAGSGFGASTSWQPRAAGDCDLLERDADGDGILNSEDADWVRPMDGSGYGVGLGYRQNLSGTRPMDASGFGARQGLRASSGVHDGSYRQIGGRHGRVSHSLSRFYCPHGALPVSESAIRSSSANGALVRIAPETLSLVPKSPMPWQCLGCSLRRRRRHGT
ncbi:hypothetical protein IH601_12240 [Candidatus Bipolaricaulota bacterium]|nr:hypothetical protein [Candidatus Bipolaricaulota bacterium]TFH08517.1 MAG: hypothetical protein E4H08_07645 [Candidatus Atribacteria bacterium]